MVDASNIILLCWLIFLGYWILNWKSAKPAQEIAWRAPGFRWTLLWIVVLILVISRFLFHTQGFQIFNIHARQTTILDVIGIVITIAGLLIAIVARRTLADNWSSDVELKKDHKLITKGAYKYVRHPIYTGITLMGIGSIIVDQSLLVTLFYLGMVAFLIYKMQKEEKLLLKHFPKEYPGYMKKTKALFPFIY